MGLPHEVDEVVVFKRHPLGIHLPEHVLRGHFVDCAAAEAAAAIGTQQGLEGVAELVGQHAIGFAVDADGGCPEAPILSSMAPPKAVPPRPPKTKMRNLYLEATDVSLSTHLSVLT